jgi:hypothetical protein
MNSNESFDRTASHMAGEYVSYNEPVAWMLVDASWNDFCRYSSYPSEGAIPLYTHPADLTDEEIMDCIEDKTGYSFNACDEDLLDFARAILRKAQEK